MYNRTSKKILLDYAFQYVDKIYFHIGANNMRSQKAILNIGAHKIGEVDFDYYGQKVLHYEYVILKKDWEENIFSISFINQEKITVKSQRKNSKNANDKTRT